MTAAATSCCSRRGRPCVEERSNTQSARSAGQDGRARRPRQRAGHLLLVPAAAATWAPQVQALPGDVFTVNSHKGQTLKMNLYTKQATNQNLRVYFEDILCECCSGTNCIFVLGVGVIHALLSNTLYSLTPNKEDIGHSGHIPCIS